MLWIRIHKIQIQIQFRIRIQGFDGQNWRKKIQLEKGPPRHMRSFQTSKENIQNFFPIFVGHFPPPGSTTLLLYKSESHYGMKFAILFKPLPRMLRHTYKILISSVLDIDPYFHVSPDRSHHGAKKICLERFENYTYVPYYFITRYLLHG